MTRRRLLADLREGEAERWLPIPGLPGYEVSDRGRILSHKKNRTRLLAGYGNRGYRKVTLFHDGHGVHRGIHALVAAAFIGPRPQGMQVRHLDGDPTNNVLSNLAYGTASENIADQVRHGTHHRATRTHCPRNHPYDEVNTRLYRGIRYCRACQRRWAANAAVAAALRAAAVVSA